MSEIAETIMGQLHHTKPDHLVPGRDVGAEVCDEGMGLHVVIVSEPRREAWITYDEGADLYDVVRQIHGQDMELFQGEDVFTLGGIVWGDDAKPYDLPTVQVSMLNDDGTTTVIYEG